MNRRSFLRFCGIAPVVPMVAVEAVSKPKLGACTLLELGEPINFPGIYIEGKKQPEMFIHTFTWNDSLVDVLTWKDGAYSFWIKAKNQEKLERLFVNDREVEIAKQGGTGLVLSADQVIRIDHECKCRNMPIPELRSDL